MLTPKGFRIKKDSLPKDEIDRIKEELTVTPIVLSDYTNTPESFPVYRQSTTHIYLPKFYAFGKSFVPTKSIEREGEPIDVSFCGKLRENQIEPMQKTLENIQKNDSTILCVGCGFGKTTLALYIVSQIAKKTLIVVHKEFLMNQWIERIQQFLPNTRIGIVRQNVVDLENKDIVVCMLQSLTIRGYPPNTFDSIGQVVIDECHHICTKTFSKAFYSIGAKKFLGLSATPYRKDGLTKVLNWFLGDILHFTSVQEDIATPIVKIVRAKYETQPLVEYNYRGKVNLPNLITKISQDPTRNQQIVGEIKTLLGEGRKILVLTERRQQCLVLQRELGVLTHHSTGLYIGGMKEKDLAESNKKDVIFATYNMAAEGYDCSTLDTLVMATGRSDIEQSVGRILRKKNKNVPKIVDIHDNLEGLRSQSKRRLQYYRSRKFSLADLGSKKENTEKALFLD